ncbi:neuropeptide FF receptor 1-like [Montipora foliosa]|uniref:neuropeptide FF receptor 1-like n=1 Tax=Montipora foliosa TaxID=591990 RepID=UPI0035F1199A
MEETVKVAITTITSILIVTSIVGNSIVCVVVIKNRDMRIPINYLIVNLAVADTIYSIFLVPMLILSHISNHPEGITGKVLCTLLTDGNVAWIGAASAVITLTAIAFERYRAVIHPQRKMGSFTMRKLKFIIFASWAFAFILQIPQFLNKEFNREINPHFCISAWREKWITRAFFLVWLAFYVISFALMAVLYYKIIRALWFKRDGDNNATHQQQGVLKVRQRVTLMVVAVTVIFSTCWGIESTMHVLVDVSSIDLGPLASPIAHTMIMFNSAVNPFAYALISQRFRQKIKETICRRSILVDDAVVLSTSKRHKSIEMVPTSTLQTDAAGASFME